jgi:ATP/maltotriose-dependent transcriptional regulator MalT
LPLKVFLSGRASDELDALRGRVIAETNLEIVDRAELAEAVISLPASARFEQSARRPAREYNDVVEHLTTREHDVLALVADGLPNRDIASALAISEHTVKFHLASIFGKLGVSTRTEAVQRGLRLGVIDI